MVKMMIVFLFFTFSACFLAACASVNRYDASNFQNRTIKPISMPSGMSSSKIKSYYPVPATTAGAMVQEPSLVPPDAKKL